VFEPIVQSLPDFQFAYTETTTVRCKMREGLALFDNCSKNETTTVLFADKGLRRIGNVRILSVSYEQQSVTVEMDDCTEGEYLSDSLSW